MTRRITFHLLAERDTTAAFNHYQSDRPGLGSDFLTELARCLESISRMPKAGKSVSERRRRRLLKRFPFAVIYRLTEHEIRVLAVAHHARRPYIWVDRD